MPSYRVASPVDLGGKIIKSGTIDCDADKAQPLVDSGSLVMIADQEKLPPPPPPSPDVVASQDDAVADAGLPDIGVTGEQSPPPPPPTVEPPKDDAAADADVLDIGVAGAELAGVQTQDDQVKSLSDLSVPELKKMASDAGIKGAANMNKAKLVKALTNA